MGVPPLVSRYDGSTGTGDFNATVERCHCARTFERTAAEEHCTAAKRCGRGCESKRTRTGRRVPIDVRGSQQADEAAGEWFGSSPGCEGGRQRRRVKRTTVIVG